MSRGNQPRATQIAVQDLEEFEQELAYFLARYCAHVAAEPKARIRARCRLRVWRAQRRDIRQAIAHTWEHEPNDQAEATAPTKHQTGLIRDYARVYAHADAD